jgi:hypothetical protein
MGTLVTADADAAVAWVACKGTAQSSCDGGLLE